MWEIGQNSGDMQLFARLLQNPNRAYARAKGPPGFWLFQQWQRLFTGEWIQVGSNDFIPLRFHFPIFPGVEPD